MFKGNQRTKSIWPTICQIYTKELSVTYFTGGGNVSCWEEENPTTTVKCNKSGCKIVTTSVRWLRLRVSHPDQDQREGGREGEIYCNWSRCTSPESVSPWWETSGDYQDDLGTGPLGHWARDPKVIRSINGGDWTPVKLESFPGYQIRLLFIFSLPCSASHLSATRTFIVKLTLTWAAQGKMTVSCWELSERSPTVIN